MDFFSCATGELAFKMTKQEHDRLCDLLDECDRLAEEKLGDDFQSHGFTLEWFDGSSHLYADESFWIETLEHGNFLKELGEAIAGAGLPYLEVGFSCTATRCAPGSHGGGAFRIYPDGHIAKPRVVWMEPGEELHDLLMKASDAGSHNLAPVHLMGLEHEIWNQGHAALAEKALEALKLKA